MPHDAIPAVIRARGIGDKVHRDTLPHSALAAILGLLVLNIGLSWWHWDTLPSLPGFDEVMINDGAVGLAHLGPLRQPGVEGTAPALISAVYPPLFLHLQAGIFRVFGLNPLSLRLSSKLPYLAVCILGLLILRRLWERRVLSPRAAMAVAILWLSDLAGFWIARQARMEPLEELIGMSAAWLLLSGPDERRNWWLASALLGFAFSTHLSAVLFWIPMLAGLWFYRGRLGWRVMAGCAALPFVILGALWVAANREHTIDALVLLSKLNADRTHKGLEPGFWLTSLSKGFFSEYSLRELLQRGGPAYWIMISSWIFVASRFRAARNNKWLSFGIACAAGHALCTIFVTDSLSQRIVLIYPFALLALGVALTESGVRWERPVLVLAVLMASIQFAGILGYLARKERLAPDRFDSLRLPAGIKSVATTDELWYHFVSRGIPFRLIPPEQSCCADDWRLHHERVNDFDAVILPEGDEMLDWPELAGRPRVSFTESRLKFVMFLKRDPG